MEPKFTGHTLKILKEVIQKSQSKKTVQKCWPIRFVWEYQDYARKLFTGIRIGFVTYENALEGMVLYEPYIEIGAQWNVPMFRWIYHNSEKSNGV